MTSMQTAPVRYHGTHEAPLPPACLGWGICQPEDVPGMEMAKEIEKTNALPLWHYQDLHAPEGLYRAFRWETPTGPATSMLKYMGVEAAQAALAAQGAAGGSMGAPPAEDDEVAAGFRSFIGAMGAVAPGSGGGTTGGGTTGGGGTTTPQTAPPPSATVASWTPDASSNSTAVGIANSILFQGSPVAWADQMVYYQTINGQPWAFTGNYENGMKYVIAWRGNVASPQNPSPVAPTGGGSSGMSTGEVVGVVAALVAVTGAIVWAVMANR